MTPRLFWEKLDTLSRTVVRKGPKLGVSLRSVVGRNVSDILGDISSSEPWLSCPRLKQVFADESDRLFR